MNDSALQVWRLSKISYVMLAVAAVLMYLIFQDGIHHMVRVWETREEYGHGFLIPLICGFLIWQRKDVLEKIPFSGSWLGVVIIFYGLFQAIVGELSSIFTLIEYAFVITLVGVVLSLFGIRAFKLILIPMLILFFMVPLPNFFFFNLSSQLQLISSQLGVALIRLFDISVYLEGNVIDLGTMKLQVVEACSGLNYLFPLMTLSFISAYFFTGEFWKKALIFISSIPITVFMNSFRIGVIGVTVEYWGPEMADGVLHDFEGYVVFMACIGILIIEMWVLSKIGKTRLPLKEAFGLEFPEPTPDNAIVEERKTPRQLIASIVLLAVVAILASVLPERHEIEPDRKEFSGFPMNFENWQGRKEYLENIYIDALKFTDYTMIDYVNPDGAMVNFYSAYYASQRKGASAHSPRSCIPGGGWRITSLDDYYVPDVSVGDLPLKVNRLVISKGGAKQLVYYWFQQRGRIVTNEYMMKWYLFWDGITMQRTDGALVRFTTVLPPGRDISIADERLQKVVKNVAPILPAYVPN